MGDQSWLRGRLSTLRDPRVIVARRELSVLRREKTTVLALLIQLFIAAFSSFLVVGLVSLYAPVSVREILEGKLLTGVVLAPAQAALWLTLLSLNGTPVHAPGRLLALVTALTLLVVVLGFAVSLPVGSRRAAQSLYSLGTLTLFAIATLSPGDPVNTVALLAIGSAGATQTATVAGYLVFGVLALWGLRQVLNGQTAETW